MNMPITGRRSELGALLAAQGTAGDTHFDVFGQQANTLLHDGHAWRDFSRTALAAARRALQTEAGLVVHASFAFVHGCPDKDPLRSIAQTVLECESLVLAGPVPTCVVRLGYLYGPESRDLLAYRKAFRIGRPYWAGPRNALQHHLHLHDAVAALVKAARARNAGKVFYATDGTPVAFRQFMDEFARRAGNPFPLHVPRIATALIKLVVRKEHMQQVTLQMPPLAPVPCVPGWKPRYADYREGLEQALAAWGP
jgi:nucleoside-diphosphate-sugar epimerase